MEVTSAAGVDAAGPTQEPAKAEPKQAALEIKYATCRV